MWQHASDRDLQKYFEGENIWSKKWNPIAGVTVIDPNYGNEREAELWEVEIAGKTKQFVASEFSNNCWVFFLKSKP